MRKLEGTLSQCSLNKGGNLNHENRLIYAIVSALRELENKQDCVVGRHTIQAALSNRLAHRSRKDVKKITATVIELMSAIEALESKYPRGFIDQKQADLATSESENYMNMRIAAAILNAERSEGKVASLGASQAKILVLPSIIGATQPKTRKIA